MTHREIEEAVIGVFIHHSQQNRLSTLMKKKKSRSKFRNMLAHSIKLNENNSSKIPSNKQDIASIYQLLKAKGAPNDCYVISEDPCVDGTIKILKDALDQTIGFGNGTIISCIHGKLGFYEGEGKSERYILFSNK